MRGVRSKIVFVLAILTLASMDGTVTQEPYHVAIVGGRVIDPETGLDAVRSVGIRGDLIAVVAEERLGATTVIDADNAGANLRIRYVDYACRCGESLPYYPHYPRRIPCIYGKNRNGLPLHGTRVACPDCSPRFRAPTAGY